MLRALIKKFIKLLSVSPDNPELLLAQYKVFSRQVPLMYLILLVNTWILAILFLKAAPIWLSLYIPIILTIVSGFRLTRWWLLRHDNPTTEIAYRALKRTNILTCVLSIAFVCWSLSLYPYGDFSLNGNIAFYMAITGVAVIFCMMNLRSAAFLAALIINTSFILYFGFQGIPSFIAMAINMMFVSAALFVVLMVQYRSFTEAVDAKTKLGAMNEENFRLSNLDSLTSLPNRRQFFTTLKKAFADAEHSQSRLAVGIIDLDGFKPINDLHGHAVGDSLLIEVSNRLSTFENEQVHLSRLGGDEFALIVKQYEDDDLLKLGKSICEALKVSFQLQEANIKISGSLGFAAYPLLAATVEELYVHADYALYQSKNDAHNGAVLFSNEHIAEIQTNDGIEQQLRSADLKKELTLHFQPIIDMRLNEVVAFEALARWSNPALGDVPPSEFIPVAERTGLVNQLTAALLEKALMVASTWPVDIRLSFNLSSYDIRSNESVLRILSIIKKSGFDPKRLDLEITETAMMRDFCNIRAAIESLKALGCGIALDDFGTGFSSLSRLHALPLTKIKIDRSFVSNIHEKPVSYKIVRSLLALSRDMDLDCVIEGAETQEEIDTLNELGGQTIQGYYFGKPIPETRLPDFLAQQAATSRANSTNIPNVAIA